MLRSSDVVVFLLAACGLVAGGYLLGLRRLLLERRRAIEAERRAGSFMALLDALSHKALPSPAGTSRGVPESPPRPSLPALESRYLFVSFEEEIRRAGGRAAPLTLLTLSLGDRESDDETGLSDRLLRAVAYAVRRQMRGCDTCVRYAADQFILILPDVSRDEARRVESRMRLAVHGVVHEPRPGMSVHVHASLGSATFPTEGSSFDQLLTLADSRRMHDRVPAEGWTEQPDIAARFRVPPPALSRN
ncbi:MAG TPA: GGDEF domain-containing protein [Candidatus Polarisedimenticolia bacterium]|nr:GGDEF domain-containing protein [Candidatus Polarisedimenticolia bacterium]